ncbi:MAG: extracellular solute-binding protein, partial [Planctomycetota bacterium]|nr:extracellular solute-binding protein [Planctomycetota bacterium]
VAAFILWAVFGGRSRGKSVCVYTSVDQVHAEPILRAFEAETGIKVLAVYDIEANKTTGLADRLIAERKQPQADVFWNGEFSQTLRLREKGVLAAIPAAAVPAAGDVEGYWRPGGGRARVILVNKSRLPPAEYPASLQDFLAERYPGEQIAIARPLFGTTATHAAALAAVWGQEKAIDFFRRLRARGVRVVEGNSVVRDLVAKGEIMFGLTDTDDALGAIQAGAKVEMIYPDQNDLGTLVVPTTVAMINGAPHAEEAQRLIAYLVRPDTQERLARIGWSQLASDATGVWREIASGREVRAMAVSLTDVQRCLEPMQKALREIFLQ